MDAANIVRLNPQREMSPFCCLMVVISCIYTHTHTQSLLKDVSVLFMLSHPSVLLLNRNIARCVVYASTCKNMFFYIYFRDGVSESQFNQVLNIELDQIIKVLQFNFLGPFNVVLDLKDDLLPLLHVPIYVFSFDS